MGEYLARLPFGELMGLLSVSGGLLIGLIAVAGGIWSEVRKTEITASLKHDMLARGMSAEDIRMVLDAGTRRAGRCAGRSSAAYTA
jgi:hypothetical protein